VEEGHHGFGAEGVELVEPVVVELGLPHEQHHADAKGLLLEVGFEGEGEGVQRLRVQNQVVR
jgi:hypothetical protein